MSHRNKLPGPALTLLRNSALLLCLFAPSAWMIATIPPLWRDADAYIQLTQPPLVSTFWGHAPAYCYAAKVPLFLGEKVEQWRGVPPTSSESGLSPLTDTGVWLLILAQHLALGGAAFYFIVTISTLFWARLALAFTWAGNALSYTFAHCVGSETLSVILLVLVVAKGLRLIRSRSQPRWIDWYVFAIILCLCFLSRHVNLFLILLLPTALLLASAWNRGSSFFASSDRQRRWLRGLRSRWLRHAVIALAIGLACVAVANSLTDRLARKTRFHPHSRIGYTFTWRLRFLKNLAPESRGALLQKVSGRSHSTETRQLIALLEQMHQEGAEPVGLLFLQRAAPLLFPGETTVPWEKLDVAVNQMAYGFLLPPTPEHLRVARTELLAALRMPVTEIVATLFNTTSYFFEHKDEMPACARLVTFRDTTADSLNRIPSQYLYLHLWRDLSYNKTLVIWFVGLLGLVAAARWRNASVGAVPAFAISLVGIGLLMVASACLLTGFLPRYAFPMWHLLLLSTYVLIGATADLFTATSFKRSAPLPIGKEKSAGQLPKLG